MRANLTGQRTPQALVGPAVAGTVVAIDQLAKTAAPYLRSTLVAPARNPEYAFGAAGGSALALVVGSVVVLAVFLAVVARMATRFGVSPCLPALVAGGTLANTLDRIQFGAVRDFLVLPWGIVNLADLAVAAGVISLLASFAIRAPRHPARLGSTARAR